MNLNAYNGNARGKYALRTYHCIFDYGNCGLLADYYCEAETLEDAIEEVEGLVDRYNREVEANGGEMYISPRWISKKTESGASYCCYEFSD